MANDYTSTTFYIDTNTDVTGLTALKGSAPDINDDLFVFSGAEVNATTTLTVNGLHLGDDGAGVTSAGVLNILVGADLELADGASGGLFIEASGLLTAIGSAGSKSGIRPGQGQASFNLQKMDGIIQTIDAEIDSIEFLCAVAGNLDMTRTSMTTIMSATSELIISGTMVLASSEIYSANRWACLNYDTLTMDKFSVLKNAYFAITNSTSCLIFIDDPTDYEVNPGIRIVRDEPLGGTVGRGKRIGSARKMNIFGSFSTASGSDHLTYWLKLLHYIDLIDTFKLVWPEGSINKFMFSNGNLKLSFEDVDERSYNIELLEIA